MNKIIKTIMGTICLIFLIASGVPLMSNDGLLRVVGLFNYFSGSILLYFILYRYCSMEEVISAGVKNVR